ncbi:MAG: glycosyltransferase family A protein, partial [Actinomycetota bacterium]
MTSTEPTVTVVTPAHNATGWLCECIESIRAQTYEDWEHVIVDDVSTDHTPDLVRRYSELDPRIKLIQRTERGGPFVAGNDGLRAARGAYFCAIDADDIAPSERIERQLGFLRSESTLRACITPWQSFADGKVIGGVTWLPRQPELLAWYLLLFATASHSSLFAETDVLREIGGYRNLPSAQDFRLVSDLSRAGVLGVIPEVLSLRRRHPAERGSVYSAFIESREQAESKSDMELWNAVEIMRDHLRDLACVEWSDHDLAQLWLAGHWKQMALGPAVSIINRWLRLAMSDPRPDE